MSCHRYNLRSNFGRKPAHTEHKLPPIPVVDPEPNPLPLHTENEPVELIENVHEEDADDLEESVVELHTRALESWHWNLYQSVGLTIEASQKDIARKIRKIQAKCHPDKRPGYEDLFHRISFVHDIVVVHYDRYRKLLCGDYFPHGGKLLDEKAMQLYITGRTDAYSPGDLLPEVGPRRADRHKSESSTRLEINKMRFSEKRKKVMASWSMFSH